MTYTEADVERVAHAVCRMIEPDDEPCARCPLRDPGPRGGVRGCIHDAEKVARAALAAMPSPARTVLQEARDACAAACRVIAEAGLSERLEAELAKAGVKTGFGARMDAALAAMPDGRAAVIEECAKVSETMAANIRRLHGEKFYHVKIGSLLMCCDEIAQNIRALKAQPASPGSGE